MGRSLGGVRRQEMRVLSGGSPLARSKLGRWSAARRVLADGRGLAWRVSHARDRTEPSRPKKAEGDCVLRRGGDAGRAGWPSNRSGFKTRPSEWSARLNLEALQRGGGKEGRGRVRAGVGRTNSTSRHKGLTSR
jgi:hypothetical protein